MALQAIGVDAHTSAVLIPQPRVLEDLLLGKLLLPVLGEGETAATVLVFRRAILGVVFDKSVEGSSLLLFNGASVLLVVAGQGPMADAHPSGEDQFEIVVSKLNTGTMSD